MALKQGDPKMSAFQKIVLLAHLYHTEDLGQDCTNLESSMSNEEISSAIQLANLLSESN